MSKSDDRAEIYRQRINQLSGELSSLNSRLNHVESEGNSLDLRIGKFPSRISSIRRSNYMIQTSLEADSIRLSDAWASSGPALKEQVRSRASVIRGQIRMLEGEVASRRGFIGDIFQLSDLEGRISSVGHGIAQLEGSTHETLNSFIRDANAIEQVLSSAESSVALAQGASFQWGEGETLVASVRAKNMNTDIEGVLTLTSRRLLFESEDEIVLKRTLFIATEKKKVRALVTEYPVGSINSLAKGRVGLLAGHGLFIDFKNGGSEPLKLDTKGEEADLIVRSYGLIMSGQVDEELGKLGGAPKEETKIVVCPRCGAPYTDEVFRGQVTVNCKYCGSSIAV